MSSPESQAQQIYEHMAAHHAITPLEALNLYGCMRLGARIWDLRKAGIAIASELVRTASGKHVASYSLDVAGHDVAGHDEAGGGEHAMQHSPGSASPATTATTFSGESTGIITPK